MTHYICTGTCNGVSDVPGTCQAKDCPKHEEMLQSCDCVDGKHYGRQAHIEQTAYGNLTLLNYLHLPVQASLSETKFKK